MKNADFIMNDAKVPTVTVAAVGVFILRDMMTDNFDFANIPKLHLY